MKYNELIEEIVSRVSSYLDNEKCDKDDLIILTNEHGDTCHEFLESPTMNKHFNVKCALMNDYECDVENCAGIVMFELSNIDLSRIVSGVCDTPFTAMAAKALLLGKPIWVIKENVEILKYNTDNPYAKMMHGKFCLLKSFGVVLCSKEDLTDTIVGTSSCNNDTKCSNTNSTSGCEECCEEPCEEHICKEIEYSKKVITEKDMENARFKKAGKVLTGAKSIVTDLAKEYAYNFGIEIIRS